MFLQTQSSWFLAMALKEVNLDFLKPSSAEDITSSAFLREYLILYCTKTSSLKILDFLVFSCYSKFLPIHASFYIHHDTTNIRDSSQISDINLPLSQESENLFIAVITVFPNYSFSPCHESRQVTCFSSLYQLFLCHYLDSFTSNKDATRLISSTHSFAMAPYL